MRPGASPANAARSARRLRRRELPAPSEEIHSPYSSKPRNEGRGEHQDEVLNSGYILGAREGRFRDGLDSEGKRLERKGALLARSLVFPAPEIRKVAGAQSLFIFRCVCESRCECARAGILQVGICFCPSLAKGESSVKNLSRGLSRSRGIARAWRAPREP